MADFSVPWQPLDLRPGAEFLLGAINQKRQRDIAERQAATQEEYAKLGFAKLSAAAERERKKYDQDQQERLIRATADAEALEDAGNVNAADRLRRLHGIKVEPVLKSNLVSPSTVITPMEALGGPSRRQQLERPQPENPYRSPSTSDTRGAITPVQALEPDPEGTGAEETMPLTIPSDVEQHISSQTKLIGPRGEDLGINDPEARKAARLAKAERLRTVLGTVSPELGAIASLEAEGDLSAKDYAPTVKAYTSQQAEGGRNTRAQNAIDARQGKQDDQQAFLEAENAKYRTTPEEREKLARIAAQGRMGAAGNSPVPAASELARMAEHNASDEEMQKFAAEHRIGPNDYKKIVDPAARRTEAHAKLLVKDVMDGRQLEAVNQQAANEIGKMGPNIKQLVERTQKYIDHVRKFGPRVPPGSREDTMRRSLAKSAAVAGKAFHQLGAALGWLHAEEDILGPSGSSESMMGWLLGARPDVIRNQLEEAKLKYKAAVDARTRPAEMSGQAYRGKPDERKTDQLENMLRDLIGGGQ